MYLAVYVTASAAVRAGRSQSGRLAIEITDTYLASLSPELRDQLARSTLCETREGALATPSYGAASTGALNLTSAPELPQVTAALQSAVDECARQIAERQRDTAEAEAREVSQIRAWLTEHADPGSLVRQDYSSDPYTVAPTPYTTLAAGKRDRTVDHPILAEVAALRAAALPIAQRREAQRQADLAAQVAQREREAAEKKALAAAQEIRTREAIAAMVEAHGSTSQRERQQAGVLPRAEALDLVRSAVFAPIDLDRADMPRYKRLAPGDFAECRDTEAEVEFGARDLEEIPAHAWERYTEISKAAPTGAKVTLREHYGRCSCDADSDCPTRDWCHDRLSVLVSLDWHGVALSREYAVPEAPAAE